MKVKARETHLALVGIQEIENIVKRGIAKSITGLVRGQGKWLRD